MASILPEQTSDCANPVLDIFTSISGNPVDIFSLEYQICEKVTTPGIPLQVFPPAGRATADVNNDCPTGHRLATGRYVAEWTVPVAEPVGTHCVKWFFKLTAGAPEQSFTEEFEVLPAGAAPSLLGYCTLADVREEGVSVTQASDARIEKMIKVASRYIDEYTGRYFSPRARTYKFDGRGHAVLFMSEPIIDITKITIELTPGTVNPLEVDLTDLSIYNRHITQGLTDPDDRNHPKVEFFRSNEDIIRAAPGSVFLAFPVGRQNITVEGSFGFTDYDGSATGKTPDLICEACLRLVMRLYKPKNKNKVGGAGSVWKMVTRDQRVEYGEPTRLAIQGAFSGDPEIDQILARYRRPAKIGVA